MATETLVASQTFIATIDGTRVRVVKGKTRVRADHPLVKGRERLFKPADTQFEDIEDTLARPGHRRGQAPSRSGSRPAKKAAAKKSTGRASKRTRKSPAAKKAEEPAADAKG